MKRRFSSSLFVILIAFLPTQSLAQYWDTILAGQIEALIHFEREMQLRIQVGMTPDEVKGVLGRPQAIESGFPNSDQRIITELPGNAGQLNNSTWFYPYSAISLTVKVPQDPIYLVNGFVVNQDVFRAYADCDSVYIDTGIAIGPELGRKAAAIKYGPENAKEREDPYMGWMAKRLHVVPKDTAQTFVRTLPHKKVEKDFIPIVAVIFDKGTQVVASTKVFFKTSH